MTCLAFYNGDCVNLNSLDFLKIDKDGFRGKGSWASDTVSSGNGYNITIFFNIVPGNYLLRHEFINLNNAYTSYGAQFFTKCATIKVIGTGTAIPTNTVRSPGAYSFMDPGVFVNINTLTRGSSYVVPGPTRHLRSS
ncbi:Endoglucanase-4 [Dactylellina cionopaga]|nr:Endoglucanase-4 [Dactylellina cionopaga]